MPWNADKSWAGSAGMFGGAFVLSTVFLLLFEKLGFFVSLTQNSTQWIWLLGIVAMATFVESLPIREIDNLTLAITAVGLGLWLLG